MAAPVTSSTTTLVADNEQAADGNLTSLGTPFLDSEVVAVEQNAAPNGTNEGLRFERTSTTTADDQYAGGNSFTATDLTGQLIYTGRRQKIANQNGRNYADGGYGMVIEDSTGRHRAWRFGGFDDGYDNDEMRVRIVDPEVTGEWIEDAGFDITNVTGIAQFFTCLTSSSDAEFVILQVFYNDEIKVTRGDATTPATWDDLKTEIDTCGDYTLVFMSKIGGSLYRGVGKYVIGANDALEHVFQQSGFALEFFEFVNDLYDGGAGERYGAIAQDNTFGITIEVSSNFDLDMSFGTITSINKWYFEINGNSNPSQGCDFVSMSFSKIGTNDFEAPAVFDSCAFDDCDKLVINSASITNSTIQNPSGGTCCSILTTSTITGTAFSTATAADYAIEIASAGTYNLSGVTFTGFTTDINVTATSGTVTINVSGGGDTPTTTTAGATVIVNNSVTVKVTVKDAADSSNIENSRVYLAADTGGDLPYQDSVSITRSGSTATVTHTAHGLITGDKVVIKGANESEYLGIQTITVTGTNSYTYTVTGTPASPATGTITATSVILDGLTNASGVIEDTGFNFTSNQPVTGVVRKGTSTPLYQSSPLTGTITSSGFDVTTFLTSDE